MTRSESKAWWDNWAETHQLMTINFWWRDKGADSECTLHNKTYNQGLAIAKEFGYKEPKWYKPWTWGNGVVTVG